MYPFDRFDHTGWLGSLLLSHTNRNLEAEQALRQAIQIDPADDFSCSYLAELLANDPARISEARAYIERSLQLAPDNSWHQTLFNTVCGDAPLAWNTVLPPLAAWCVANPKNTEVFSFTVAGFLQYARLSKPADALALLEALPNPSPFETLRDTFRAHADREHLNRLAPERRAVVLELLKRLDGSGGAAPTQSSSAGHGLVEG